MSPRRVTLLAVVAIASMAVKGFAQPTARHPPGRADPAPASAGALRLTYVPGHRVRYVQRTAQVVRGVQGAPATPTVTASTMDLETVAVHPDGSADQRMRVAAMSITGDGIPASLRTTLSRGMVGTTYEFTQDARGRVASRRPPTGVPEDLRAVADGIAQSIDQLSPVLPEGPTAVGSSWQDHQTYHFAPAPGANLDMTVDVTYTLREVRPAGPTGVHPAVLAVAMTFTTPEGSSLQGMPWRGTGENHGEMTIDLGHGCVTSNRSTGTMTMHVAVAGRSLDIETQMESSLLMESPR